MLLFLKCTIAPELASACASAPFFGVKSKSLQYILFRVGCSRLHSFPQQKQQIAQEWHIQLKCTFIFQIC